MKSQLYNPEQASRNLLENRQWQGKREGIAETKHTPPAIGHYPDIFYWDGVFAAIINARAARTGGHNSKRWRDSAQDELLIIADGVDETGFLPNFRYTEHTRRFDPERTLALGRKATGSNYTQPPVLALGVRETFEASFLHDRDQAHGFLDTIYDGLVRHYDYFDTQLSNGPNDKLSFIYHPHMTGRDSDPTFDSIKPHRLERSGENTPRYIDKINIALDYAGILAHGIRLRKAGNSVEQWRGVYKMNDVMMNCMLVDNLREMAEITREKLFVFDANKYDDMADKLEHEILEKMWFPEDRNGRGAFRSLDSNLNPINEVSISNLFPLCLTNLSEEQLESLLNLMDDSFNTNYPLPSVATDSLNYDPHNHESERLWRGPVWMNMNWYLVERGLRMQSSRQDLLHRPDLTRRCTSWDRRISEKSHQLVRKSGLSEHFNPITGEGQRKRVKNFAWSNLAYLL